MPFLLSFTERKQKTEQDRHAREPSPTTPSFPSPLPLFSFTCRRVPFIVESLVLLHATYDPFFCHLSFTFSGNRLISNIPVDRDVAIDAFRDSPGNLSVDEDAIIISC